MTVFHRVIRLAPYRDSEIFSPPAVRGWKYESRWSDSKSVIREGICWYVESGLKVSVHVVEGDTVLTTQWKPDGTVWYQWIRGRGHDHVGPNYRTCAPPWLCGVTDQTEPTMPAWMKDDEKWAKALEAAR